MLYICSCLRSTLVCIFSASLFYIMKGPKHSCLNQRLKREVVQAIINGMQSHRTEATVSSFTPLPLSSNRLESSMTVLQNTAVNSKPLLKIQYFFFVVDILTFCTVYFLCFQMLRNGFLTLCHFTIPRDLVCISSLHLSFNNFTKLVYACRILPQY